MARRSRRIVARGLLAVAVVLGIAGATLPWWWPAVLRARGDVRIGEYRTSGWSHVELRDVAYEREGLRVNAGLVRVPAFGLWPASDEDPVVVARDVVITPLPVQRAQPPPPSLRRAVSDVLRAWPTLEEWLPPVRLENVSVGAVGRADPILRLSTATWNGRALTLHGHYTGWDEPLELDASRSGPETLALVLEAPEPGARVDAEARLTERQLAVDARFVWQDVRAEGSAVFDAVGLAPTHATIKAPSASLPATRIGLSGYGPISGSVDVTWTGDHYAGSVVAAAEPVDPAANLPPLEVDLRASGDFSGLRIDAADVRIPGVDATLSAPLAIVLPDVVPAAPATFALEIDLADVPRSPARGRVSGRLEVSGGPEKPPAAKFTLSGEGIQWRDGEIPSVEVEGRWSPEALVVERADVRLGEESTLHGTAELELKARRIAHASVEAALAGDTLRPWLPDAPEFAALEVQANLDGAWDQPTHRGTVRWKELTLMPGRPLSGDFAWEGRGVDQVRLGGAVSAGEIQLPLSAEVTREASDTFVAAIERLAWQDGQGEWWHLAGPTQARFGPEGISLAPARLEGESVAVSLGGEWHGPVRGRVTLDAAHVAAARLQSLVPETVLSTTLDRLELRATWNDGPVELDGSLRATYALGPDAAYALEVEYAAAGGGLAFGAVRVLDDAGVVLEGEGRLPLVLAGRASGFTADLPADRELSLQLESSPHSTFWDSLSRATGWQVREPELSARLEGTLAAPTGRIQFEATELQPPAGLLEAVRLPRFGDVSVIAAAEPDRMRIERAIWTIDDHWVSLSGEAPWEIIREPGTAAWRRARFTFAADQMPMAIASRAMPHVLGPDGSVSFKIEHTPGRGYDGMLWLDGAALRPIQPLGALRDIGGRVLVEGYKLTLRNVAAFLGGRPIEIGGSADVANPAHPTFDFHLLSSRVPLVRQEGLVLRAGMELRVRQTEDAPAHISGSVRLGRSVYVSDLLGLLPTGGGVAAPEQRPPYFSVPTKPLADWTLEVDVRGDEFLRIQNPFFRAEVSADFQLVGTLAEPQAHGRAWTEEGTITFPFGNLAIQQAEVTLTPEQPFALALHATAATRLYGYNVRLEISGTADDPRLQFSSDPPLTSQQLFLMLSTGELPDTQQGFSSSERAQRLALFVGRNLATTLGLVGGAGDGDRLVVRSGEDFSREGSETLYVEYRLDDRWSLVGEKDRFDAYNAGIKFRLVER